jgi:hypothetical protein
VAQAEAAPAADGATPEPAVAAAPTSADLAEEEELDMEEVLGGKIRKAPAAAEALPEVPELDVAAHKTS